MHRSKVNGSQIRQGDPVLAAVAGFNGLRSVFPPRALPLLSHRLLSTEARLSRSHLVWMRLEPEPKLKRKTTRLPTENFQAPPILCPLQFQEPAGSRGPSHGTDVPTTPPVGDSPSPSLAKPACPSHTGPFWGDFLPGQAL